MNLSSLIARPAVRKTVAAAALGVACSSVWALPTFTFNPPGGTLVGTPVTADNIIISDFSTVRFTSPGNFSDSGFLSVQNFQLNGAVVNGGGLNSTYGLYFDFAGVGTITGSNPFTGPTSGSFSSLNFTLYGYNGPAATFGFSGDTPTTSVATGSRVALATGSLRPGANQSYVSSAVQDPSFSSSAGANLSFVPNPTFAAFFASPAGTSFYNLAVSSFTNTPSEVSAVAGGFANGFRISQGGGSVNFGVTAPVPEPETYALMLAGMGVVGWAARRRRAAADKNS